MQRYVIQPETIHGTHTGYFIPIGLGSFHAGGHIREPTTDKVRTLMQGHYPNAIEINPDNTPYLPPVRPRHGVKHY